MLYCKFVVWRTKDNNFDERYILEKEYEDEAALWKDYCDLREDGTIAFIDSVGKIHPDGTRVPCNIIWDVEKIVAIGGDL